MSSGGSEHRAVPSRGEVEALAGYVWQFDHIAWALYPKIQRLDAAEVRLADPEFGRVDDCAFVDAHEVQAFQFKQPSTERVTFASLTAPQRTSSGRPRESLLKDLVNCWNSLRNGEEIDGRRITVRLVLGSEESDRRLIATGGDPVKISFRQLRVDVLEQIALGALRVEDVRQRWPDIVEQLRTATGLNDRDLEGFIGSLRVETSAFIPNRPGALETRDTSQEYEDVQALSVALLRRVAESRTSGETAVRLTVSQVLELIPGWDSRTRRRHDHRFPVQVDLYQPLDEAISELSRALEQARSGYVAVLGPPGSGKSTLLQQTVVGGPDRVVRYLAFVPNEAGSRRGRTTAGDFLHDVVVSLQLAGLQPDRSLPSSSEADLRVTFRRQLALAGEQFLATGRRTILVVDGLDHVRRENDSSDTLLAELPSPSAIPDGVLFVVGSQSVEPLPPQAKQHLVSDAWRKIDLRHHRLSPASMANICARVGVDLTGGQLEKVSERTSGHPLAFAYLLNALISRDEASLQSVDDFLTESPGYGNDISEQYAAYWAELAQDDEARTVFAFVARLEPPIDMNWVSTLGYPVACRRIRREFGHMFRGPDATRWRFFHDSFRQFVLEETSQDDDGNPSDTVNESHHRRLADLARLAESAEGRWRELRHRAATGDWRRVVDATSVVLFRDQFAAGRSSSSIRSDIGLLLRSACEELDGVALARGILAAAELDHRTSRLEEVDVVGTFLRADLVDLAAQYVETVAVSLDGTKLWRVLDALSDLHDLGRHEGRLVFDLIEPADLLTHQTDGRKEAVIRSWAEAATRFRPASTLLDTAEKLLARSRAASPFQRARSQVLSNDPVLEPFFAAVQILKCAALQYGPQTNEQFLQKLIELCTSSPSTNAVSSERGSVDEACSSSARHAATEVLVSRSRTALAADDVAWASTCARQLSELMIGHRAHQEAIIDLGEIAARLHQVDEPAQRELWLDIAVRSRDAISAPPAVTRSSFGYSNDDEVASIYRIRRLHCLVAVLEGAEPSLDERESAAAQSATSEQTEESVTGTAEEAQADGLAKRIDLLIHRMAGLSALVAAGGGMTDEASRVTSDLLITCYPEIEVDWNSPSHRLMRTRNKIFELAVAVLSEPTGAPPPPFVARLDRMVSSRPLTWPAAARQTLGLALSRLGADCPWLSDAVEQCDGLIDDPDVDVRLSALSRQVLVHAELGDFTGAQSLARRLLPESFGVFHRKDNQLETLTALFIAAHGDARAVPKAEFLASILAAYVEITDRSAAEACELLVEAIATISPKAGLRLALWFYATAGCCDFTSMVGRFVVGALKNLGSMEGARCDSATGRLAGAVLGHFCLPFDEDPPPSLEKAIDSLKGSHGYPSLSDEIRGAAAVQSLPSTRYRWLRAAGDQTATGHDRHSYESPSDYRDLVLETERIPEGEARARIATLDALVELRGAELESSHFRWLAHVRELVVADGDVRRCADVIAGAYDESECLIALSRIAGRLGNHALAVEMAEAAVSCSKPDAWQWMSGRERLQAHQELIRLDRANSSRRRREAAADLHRYLGSNSWVPPSLITYTQELSELVDPAVELASVWDEAASYLNGLAGNAQMTRQPNLASEVRSSWWYNALGTGTSDREGEPTCDEGPTEAAEALAAIGAICADQPQWTLRESSVSLLARALSDGVEAVQDLVIRLLTDDSGDPVILAGTSSDASVGGNHGDLVVEAAAKVVVAATSGAEAQSLRADVRLALETAAMESPSVVARHLSPEPEHQPRPEARVPLPSTYSLQLPEGVFAHSRSRRGIDIDDPGDILGPFAQVLRDASELAGMDPEQLVNRAWLLAQRLADQEPASEPLDRVAPPDDYITPLGRSMRKATLTILNDLDRAQLLPHGFAARLVDPQVTMLQPAERPPQFPRGEFGDHLRQENWIAATEARLDQLITNACRDGGRVIGASVAEFPQQEGRWTETCTVDSWLVGPTTDGTPSVDTRLQRPINSEGLRMAAVFSRTSDDQPPPSGLALIVRNDGSVFGDRRCDWTALRPDVATACNWTANLQRRVWLTSDGELAASSVMWSDGHPFHRYHLDSDTAGRGWVVIATERGSADLEQLGQLRTLYSVGRRILARGQEFAGRGARWV